MYLYRKVRQIVTLAMAMVAISPGLAAQFRAPQPERKTPRAVGVLETFPNGSRRLVPVTFFYEKRYYDATFYHATPVPFTLISETVYEVQQFGKAVGTFTVLGAVQNASQNAAQNVIQWFGSGRYKVAPDPALLAKKAAASPVVLEDSSRPVLHRRAGSEGDNPAPHPVATAAKSEDEDDPARPKLHRREGSGGDSSAAAQTQTSGQTSEQSQAQGQGAGQDPDRPKLHRGEDSGEGKSAPASAGSPASPASPAAMGSTSTMAAKPLAGAELTPSDDPEHPILRRGKPLREQSGRDLPEFSAEGKAGGGPGVARGARGEEAVTRQVAVSDAGPSETQALIYLCHEQERQQLEASARELAQAELRRLAAQRGLVLTAAAKLAPAKAGIAKNVAKKNAAAAPTGTNHTAIPELKLEEEQFVPYDLDYNNYATVVFSARYAPEASSAAAASGGASGTASGVGSDATSAAVKAASAMGRSWVVTVIAREDDGKLVKLYSAVSDPRELDLYPEVRLVDAVDPDGYGRYGLLLREQKREGVSWLLGRTTGYELQTVFETAVR